jgi:ankyrin repeat protein
LHNAALGGNAEVIALLLDCGARIDAAEGESGATPLMLAASLGRTNAVALLLRRGANPTLRDHAGHTALDRAKETDEDETIKLLETALAHLNPGTKTGT